VQFTYTAISEQNQKWKAACKGEGNPTKEAKAEACKMAKQADAYRAQELSSGSDPNECIYRKNPGPEGEYKTVHHCAAQVALTWRTCTCASETRPPYKCETKQKKYACTNYCTDKTGKQAYQMMKTDAVQAVPMGFREAGYRVPISCRRWFFELEHRWHVHWMNAKKNTAVELASMDCNKVDDTVMKAAVSRKEVKKPATNTTTATAKPVQKSPKREQKMGRNGND